MSFFSNFIKSLTQRVVYMNGPSARSKPYNPEIKTQEMCASILDCNATHIAKGRLMHVVVDENEQVKEVLLIEVKTGSSTLSSREKEVRKAVEQGRVRYVEYIANASNCCKL